MRYCRDMHGFGQTPPQAAWPNAARVAVQFVLNHEEGGENCVLHGDAASEAFLSEIVGAAQWPGQRRGNAAPSPADGKERAGHRLWRRHRATPLAHPGRRDAGRRLGNRLARPQMGRAGGADRPAQAPGAAHRLSGEGNNPEEPFNETPFAIR